ncbi:acyltransferase [Rouxiella badensis]|jgi:surface polysaccharide O-acyltransferase-like enzyme|uniref:O-acetyltransferase WecH n=1 Tax=Rouxiella badensis TaxID=1646377 RepID=A0A1X0WC07_9GAMM|nr:acyltransferase [Rouxiella badensis]MCC3702882.1 acyltransferase [Rouxiella badensis]MCC3748372.1 acyltransferase [Rouxiella badensis]ORJ24316.1 acetyltransferase [Rouxiella badensis]QII40261.1 acyltransferase [Rouxiella badensis]WAT05647.1 acyltransferase [Rouxiella badensis]
MSQKIVWIDNLRALACVMVVIIHATSFQVVNFSAIDTPAWWFANALDSLSRASVPIFFMISGALFWGEKSAKPRHFLRIGLCLLFYSAVSLLYILIMTKIGFWPSFAHILQKPVFFHLWFFYAIGLIYLLSPFIQVKKVPLPMLLITAVVAGVLANPQLPAFNLGGFHLLPLNLYITGDAFYYLLYALLGRALATLEMDKRWQGWVAGGMFLASCALIALGTQAQSTHNQNFAETYYVYCGPLVFIAALSLFVWGKQVLATVSSSVMAMISRHSLAIYGFHALVIICLRGKHLDFPQFPLLNMLYLFACGLGGGLLLGLLLQRVDGRRWVS